MFDWNSLQALAGALLIACSVLLLTYFLIVLPEDIRSRRHD